MSPSRGEFTQTYCQKLMKNDQPFLKMPERTLVCSLDSFYPSINHLRRGTPGMLHICSLSEYTFLKNFIIIIICSIFFPLIYFNYSVLTSFLWERSLGLSHILLPQYFMGAECVTSPKSILIGGNVLTFCVTDLENRRKPTSWIGSPSLNTWP